MHFSVEIRHELGDIVVDKFGLVAADKYRGRQVEMIDLPEFIGLR